VHLAGAARSRVEAPQSVSERKQHDLRALAGFHNQKFGSIVRLEYPSAPPRQFSMFRRLLPLAVGLFLAANNLLAAQTRDQMVLTDRDNVLGGGKWIYNDFTKGLDEAARTGKPLLVVLRCVP